MNSYREIYENDATKVRLHQLFTSFFVMSYTLYWLVKAQRQSHAVIGMSVIMFTGLTANALALLFELALLKKLARENGLASSLEKSSCLESPGRTGIILILFYFGSALMQAKGKIYYTISLSLLFTMALAIAIWNGWLLTERNRKRIANLGEQDSSKFFDAAGLFIYRILFGSHYGSNMAVLFVIIMTLRPHNRAVPSILVIAIALLFTHELSCLYKWDLKQEHLSTQNYRSSASLKDWAYYLTLMALVVLFIPGCLMLATTHSKHVQIAGSLFNFFSMIIFGVAVTSRRYAGDPCMSASSQRLVVTSTSTATAPGDHDRLLGDYQKGYGTT